MAFYEFLPLALEHPSLLKQQDSLGSELARLDPAAGSYGLVVAGGAAVGVGVAGLAYVRTPSTSGIL